MTIFGQTKILNKLKKEWKLPAAYYQKKDVMYLTRMHTFKALSLPIRIQKWQQLQALKHVPLLLQETSVLAYHILPLHRCL